MPVLKDPTAKVRESAYTMRSGGHMLRTERWAYLKWNKGEELYDMLNDPKQFTNLAGSEAHITTLTEMRRKLEAKLKSIDGR